MHVDKKVGISPRVYNGNENIIHGVINCLLYINKNMKKQKRKRKDVSP